MLGFFVWILSEFMPKLVKTRKSAKTKKLAKTRHVSENSKVTALVVLFSLVIVLIPQNSLNARKAGLPSMEFPRSTAYQASVMHLERGLREPYTPSKYTTNIIVTSYNSVPAQTDSSPFITAFGTQVRDGIVATNYLPRGTQVRFPDLYGTKVFVVEDRMNVRYNRHIDIWSEDTTFSKQFGARYLRMDIL